MANKKEICPECKQEIIPQFQWKEDWKKRSKWYYIIDSILLTILILLVVYARYEGAFIKSEVHIIETCQGNPITYNGIPVTDLNFTINLPKDVYDSAAVVQDNGIQEVQIQPEPIGG